MLFNLDMLTAVLFGLVEGITEWLPVSSTGHMILLNQITSFYTVSDGFFEMFEVVIQLGAICAVIIPFFWKLFPFTRESGYVQIKLSSLLLWGKIIVATIPAAIVGFFFDDAINAAFYNPMSIAIALIVVGFVFIAVERAKKGKKVRVSRLSDITFLMAFVIGMFQTIAAVFPGTSRSGITIIAMLLMGFSRKLAVEFTFLLAIPVMLGASLAKLVKLTEAGTINSSVAKEVFEKVFDENIDPDAYVKEHGLAQVNDEGLLRDTVAKVIEENPQSVEDYRNGKEKAIGFLVGQTMKAMKGKANPGMVNQILKELL